MRRTLLFVLLSVAAVGAVVLPWRRDLDSAAVAAPKDKDDKEIDRLRKQLKDREQDIDKLRRELAQRQDAIKDRDQLIAKLRAADRKEDVVDKQLLMKLQADIRKAVGDLEAVHGADYVRTVYYRLKRDAPGGEAAALIRDANAMLARARGIRGLWAGKPAPASTDEDFDVAVVLLFDNASGLKAFLDDAQVKKFDQQHGKFWDRTIRDFGRAK